MATKPFPSPETLRQLLRYEPETGKLFWLPRPREMFASKRAFSTWNVRFSGKEAFTATSEGYRVGNVNCKLCMAHRVIWALVHGRWPENDIDHVNGDRSDNRLENLREATRSQNNCNSGLRADNTSGYRGVNRHRQSGRWQARIHADGSLYNLGLFDTPEEAHAAYCAAAKKHHGEFARTE